MAAIRVARDADRHRPLETRADVDSTSAARGSCLVTARQCDTRWARPAIARALG
jgi:hypothetical protein